MRWLGFVLTALVWWLVTALGIVDPIFLASPAAVAKALAHLASGGELWDHLWSTTTRLVSGFLLGALAGIGFGILIGWYKGMRETWEGVLDFLRSIPVVVLFPLFVVLLGIGEASKIASAAWAAFPIMAINAMYGVSSTNRTRSEWLRLSRITGMRMVILSLAWEILPSIFAGLRTSFAAALIIVIVSEMFFSTPHGLGRLIYDASIVYQIPKMYAGIIVTGVLGFVTNLGFRAIEHRWFSWST